MGRPRLVSRVLRRGRTRGRPAQNTIQLLSGKAALNHGDLVRADPEANTLLEERLHHSSDFLSR